MGMDIYVGARGSGKTATLIKKSAETGAYILVATKFQAHAVYKQAKEMEYDIPFPLTVSEFFTRDKYFDNSYMKDHGLLIDELRSVLDIAFCGIPIHGATLNLDSLTDIKYLNPDERVSAVDESEQE
ncbi:replicase [Firmicutes bacterium AM31-12AC]|nr:replicase [Firmicutes bacterium AM31-12AC]